VPTVRNAICGITFGILATGFVTVATAQEAKHYRFAYDQPKTTGYGVAGDLFANKLKELSNGSILIDQYPGAQLGQEPQVLQLVKAGDVEFCISSSANAATLSPQAGVMSLHYLFRSEDHLVKALSDPKVSEAVRSMIEDTVQGAHVIGVLTLGLRSMYSKRPIDKVEDMKGLKVRVQADSDRRPDVSRLWRTDSPYAVRQCLYVPPDRRSGCRRKWRERLSREQTLRSRPGSLDDRA